MSLRINHNIASVNGHRNMLKNDMAISKSLEKLSSGLRINRAADDAAGLIISEQMRAQISGLGKAISNTETAVAMVQTAEGALDEMNTLLTKARELALHAANAGANDAGQLAADQSELDNIVSSITRIAENTQFGTKKILDGNLSNSKVLNATAVSQFTQTGLTKGDISVNVTTAGVKGASTGTAVSDAQAAALTNAGTGITVTGSSTFDNQTTLSILKADRTTLSSVTVAAGTSVSDAIGLLNATKSGVTTSLAASGAFALAADDFGTYANGSRLVIQGGSTTANVGYDIGAAALTTGVLVGGINAQINRGTDGTAALVTASALTNSTDTTIFKADGAGAGVATSAVTATHAFLADTTLELVDAGGKVLASVVAAADATAGSAAAGDTTVAEAFTALSAASNGKFTVANGTAGTVTITATNKDAASNGVFLRITAASSSVSGATATGVDNTSTGFGGVGLTVEGDRGTSFSGKNSTGSQTVNLSLASGIGGAVASYANALTVQDGAVFQIGANQGQTIALSISSVKATDLGLGVVSGSSLDSLRSGAFLTGGRAQEAIGVIDAAIDDVTNLRGSLGAVQANGLESNLNSLRATMENTIAAESIIRDVDFAAESATFTRNSIMIQASTAMLAQANQLPQNVLQLLG